jgi:hypothetical protein
MISLALGSTLMISILVRYIKTKKKLTHWSPPKYDSGAVSHGTSGTGSSAIQSRDGDGRAPKNQGFHDRWLMVRFCISFVILVYVTNHAKIIL